MDYHWYPCAASNCFAVMVAINWSDESPSPATLEMAALVESRPIVSDSESAFVYLMVACVSQNEDSLKAPDNNHPDGVYQKQLDVFCGGIAENLASAGQLPR